MQQNSKVTNPFYLWLTYLARYYQLKQLLDLNAKMKWSIETFEKIKEFAKYEDLKEFLYSKFQKNPIINIVFYLSIEAIVYRELKQMEDYKHNPIPELKPGIMMLSECTSAGLYTAIKKGKYRESREYFSDIDLVFRNPKIFAKALQCEYLNGIVNEFLTYQFSITHRYYNPNFHDDDCDYNCHNDEYSNRTSHYRCHNNACTGCECHCDMYDIQNGCHDDHKSFYENKNFTLNSDEYTNRIKYLTDLLEQIFTMDTAVPKLGKFIIAELKIKSSSLPLVLLSLSLNAQRNLKLTLIGLDPTFNLDWTTITPYDEIDLFPQYYKLFTEQLDASILNASPIYEQEQHLINAYRALKLVAEDRVRSCKKDYFTPLLNKLLDLDMVINSLVVNKILFKDTLTKLSETISFDYYGYYQYNHEQLSLLDRLLREPKFNDSLTDIFLNNADSVANILKVFDKSENLRVLFNFTDGKYRLNKNKSFYIALWFLDFNLTHKTPTKIWQNIVPLKECLSGEILSLMKGKARYNLLEHIKIYLIDMTYNQQSKPQQCKLTSFHLFFYLVMQWYDLTFHTTESENDLITLRKHLIFLLENKDIKSELSSQLNQELHEAKSDTKNCTNDPIKIAHNNAKITQLQQSIQELQTAYQEDEYDEELVGKLPFESIDARIKNIEYFFIKMNETKKRALSELPELRRSVRHTNSTKRFKPA